MMQALMESSAMEGDECPKPPEGVHYSEKGPERYSEMMAGLVDQVKGEVGGGEPEDWYERYVKGVEGHKGKVEGLQRDLVKKLGELEREEGKKITSESIRDGFNISSVAKEKKEEKPKTPAKTRKEPSRAVEVLNPSAVKKDALRRLDSGGQTSGADADVDEPGTNEDIASATTTTTNNNNNNDSEEDDDDESGEATPLGQAFARIPPSDYSASLTFITTHPTILHSREENGLLMCAFNASLAANPTLASHCVHQALLLQYCRALGPDGVRLFFRRVTTPGHNAQKVFLDDVRDTFARIQNRTEEMRKEQALHPAEHDVEQIQLHAVEPGSAIHINIPQPDAADDVEQQARILFERFPPGLQRALESGSLERVNEVLGKMSVGEAEEVVEQLSEGGMLSMERGVIDGTTEEGRERLRGLEREARGGREGEEKEARGEEGEGEEAEKAMRGLGVGGSEGPGEVDAADLD